MQTSERQFRSYSGRCLLGGIAIGLAVGVFVAGPRLHDWPASDLLWVGLGCPALGVLAGLTIVPLIVGSLVRGDSMGGGAHYSRSFGDSRADASGHADQSDDHYDGGHDGSGHGD